MKNTELRTFSSREINIFIDGVPVFGYADGDFIKLTPEGDSSTFKQGSDGGIGRSLIPTTLWTAEITLLKTSAFNDILDDFYKKDQVSGGRGYFSLSIVDLRGTTIITMPKAVITKRPEVTYGKEVGNTTWTIKGIIDETTTHIGGNE